MSEKVLAINPAMASIFCHDFTIVPGGLGKVVRDYIALCGKEVDKNRAEGRNLTKQVIAYNIVRNDDKVLIYRRKNEEEPRLDGQICVGIGGHVKYEERFDLNAAALRELQEEIPSFKPRNHPPRLVALINKNNNETDRDHFGLVFSVNWDGDIIGLNGAEFINPWDISRYWNDLESWTRILYKELISKNWDNEWW